MLPLNPLFSAQGKGKVPILVGLLLWCSIIAAPILAENGLQASSLSLHEAANRRVVVPKHRAASILPVINQSDIRSNHRVLADIVLRTLPSTCRDNLKNFYVRYDPTNQNRGLGGESTIIVTGLVPDKEFMALIIHECGHVTDLGGLQGNFRAGFTSFYDGSVPIYGDDPSVDFYRISWVSAKERKQSSIDKDFVSGYAASDPFEDFAEAYAFYALQQKEFERLAQGNSVLRAKYEFMKNVVFAETAPVGDGTFVRGRSVPWDVTRLPYEWIVKR